MNAFVAVLFLACAASGQIIGAPWGLNRAWSGAPLAYSGAPIAYSGAPVAWNSAPVAYSAPTVAYNAPAIMPAPMVTSSQYHSQDELGQASFGYAHPGQAASNFRDALGNQVGSYAYINPEGKEVKVSYVADSLGFRVLSNDLPIAPVAAPVAALPMPIPVSDTVEVVEAKNAHFAAIAAAKSGVVPAPVVIGDLPKQVEDTPEVAAAKAEHFAAKAAASSRTKRQILSALPYANNWMTGVLPYSAPMMAAPMAYSAPVMSAPVISAPAVRDATLMNVVNTPGHAMSYRVY